jgi:hypothetical protein
MIDLSGSEGYRLIADGGELAGTDARSYSVGQTTQQRA